MHPVEEITRLRLLLAERDRLIDELLALIKEQHENLVFKVEHRTPVD